MPRPRHTRQPPSGTGEIGRSAGAPLQAGVRSAPTRGCEPLDFEDFDALRRLIRMYSGIWLGDSKTTFLQARLQERLRARSIRTAREYYYFLKYDALGVEEAQHLIDAVTINETWFFRETGSLRAWRDTVLPTLLQDGGRLRLWSAACSTGEEPYTLAMLLLEILPKTAVIAMDLIATDINRRVLLSARAGSYDAYSLRHTEPRFLTTHFQHAGEGQWSLNDDVRRLVRFEAANLIDPAEPRCADRMDVILCRNVLFYFDAESRGVALLKLYSALKPGGVLILSESEMLAHGAGPFELARIGGALLYRKPFADGTKST
jgi:chemotaxis protein methyltransferase CheR